jgi:serine/threonine protein kinase
LAVAHAEGVTHRDLKPANVFLTRSEEGDLLVKVLDFGIARMARHIVKKGTHAPTRLTMKGLVLGTPSYMSPEQAMAEPTDVRTDVWALATLAYEALAGVTPFHAESADDVILRICNFRPTPLPAVLDTATVELAAVFERAFVASIDKRFQTAPDFASALAAALPPPAGQLSLPPPRAQVPTESVAGMSLKVPLRPRTVASAIAVAVVALVIAGVTVGPRLLSRSVPSHGDTVQRAHSTLADVPPPPPIVSVVATALPNVPTQTDVAVRPTDTVHHATSQTSSAAPVTSAHTSAQPDTTPPPSKSVDRSAIF